MYRLTIPIQEILRKLSELYKMVSKLAQAGMFNYLLVVGANISVLLTFACADLLEIQKDTKTCTEIYTSLIENLTAEVEDLQKTVSAEVEAAKGPEIPNAPQTTDDEINMSDQMKRLVEEREVRGKMVEQRRGKEVLEIETAISISWIMFMRSTRRSEVSLIHLPPYIE
jgi:cleavage stimulation factor subunit 3